MTIPSRRWYDPDLDAYLHTGEIARNAVLQMPHGLMVAIDIETPGFDRQFDINCVTAAWEEDGKVLSAILDPRRDERDQRALACLTNDARHLVLHNAPFDTPALVHHDLMNVEDCNKIVDTLVLARLAFPDVTQRKTLEALSVRHLGLKDFEGGMERAFHAAGFKNKDLGWAGLDIHSPVYRQGAMADTVATLRLEPIMRFHCRAWLQDHPFSHYGATSAAQADEIIATQEIVHRVMLRRTARGLAVDLEHLARYEESVDVERKQAESRLAEVGLLGGTGKALKLLEFLEEQGSLPPGWPRTPKTGKLQAKKEDMEWLAELQPLAADQVFLANYDKIKGYCAKVVRQAEVTGRCHPQVNTLGASATGRMSYSQPELQQFNAGARGVIIREEGLTSVDWSQIEPVVMGLMAKDEKFLAPYERGDDLYEPLMRAAGIDRPLAKVCLLATMYGQGIKGLARRIQHSQDQAAQIRRQMLAAMPASAKWMSKVQGIASTHNVVITAAGRILAVNPKTPYLAVNYVVQGSAYDVLASTIVEMERRGIGDHMHLAMHDEVVVSTEVADEVREIMQRPLAYLEKWAGRPPVLRTDSADMGMAWAKV